MTDLRTPFHIGQSADDVIKVLKRTGRRRSAAQFQGREGTLFVNLQRKKDKEIEQELEKHTIDRTQNLTVWYYFTDCTLKFKRYRGLTGKEPSCYRVILISEPESVKDRPTSFTPTGQSFPPALDVIPTSQANKTTQ